MRKIFTVLLFLLMVIFLSSCEKELTPEEKLLLQYESFVEDDILDEAYFDQFINDVSNFTIPAMVIVKTTVKNAFGLVVEEKEGSGFIYQIFDDSLRVVTSFDVVSTDVPSATLNIQIYDYANRPYKALVLDRSEDLGLAKLIFDTRVAIAKIRKLLLSPYIPLDQEPILMISNYQRVHNSMLMGIIESKEDNDNFYHVNIPTDANIRGGAILNMRKEVVGIVIGYTDDQALIMGLTPLRQYLGL